MVTIRKATVADRAIVLELAAHVAASLPYSFLGDHVTLESLETLIDALYGAGEHAIILLADGDGGPFGGLALCEAVNPITGCVFVNDVAWWVEPDYRNRMAGPLLLHAAEQWTAERGVRTLRMAAPIPSNLHQFFERNGYAGIETTYVKGLA
jgi:GNAT superfamily N-acetyltransferase